jgi:hypothetical protein
MTTDDRPSIADVAAKIGAEWLVKPLRELADNVGAAINNVDPLRFDVRADFKALQSAASKFEKALDDVSRRRLLWWPIDGIDRISAARKAIKDMIDACDAALVIVPGGKGRPRVPNPHHPKMVCALVVVEAWAGVNGEAPSANNENAQEACDMYWRACGGGDASKNWVRSLQAARQHQSGLRNLIHDCIKQNKP